MRDEELVDFFAGLVMVGLTMRDTVTTDQKAAKKAYQLADAMVEERKRREFEEATSC